MGWQGGMPSYRDAKAQRGGINADRLRREADAPLPGRAAGARPATPTRSCVRRYAAQPAFLASWRST